MRNIGDTLRKYWSAASEISNKITLIQEALGRIEQRQIAGSWNGDLRAAEFRVFSQWGEDGIIQALLSAIPPDSLRRIFVEFGVSNYTESNTRFLLGKATERGIPKERLTCCDATALPYPAKHFDYSYSIGSLEHFTEEGIHGFMQSCRKVVKERSFHMIPVSRSQKNEGWITPWQSYFNNSTDWWIAKCKATFGKVTVLDSAWQDEISVGKWLICED